MHFYQTWSRAKLGDNTLGSVLVFLYLSVCVFLSLLHTSLEVTVTFTSLGICLCICNPRAFANYFRDSVRFSLAVLDSNTSGRHFAGRPLILLISLSVSHNSPVI